MFFLFVFDLLFIPSWNMQSNYYMFPLKLETCCMFSFTKISYRRNIDQITTFDCVSFNFFGLYESVIDTFIFVLTTADIQTSIF